MATLFSILLTALLSVMMLEVIKKDYDSCDRDKKTSSMFVLTMLSAGWMAYNLSDFFPHWDWFVFMIVVALVVPAIVFLVGWLWLCR